MAYYVVVEIEISSIAIESSARKNLVKGFQFSIQFLSSLLTSKMWNFLQKFFCSLLQRAKTFEGKHAKNKTRFWSQRVPNLTKENDYAKYCKDDFNIFSYNFWGNTLIKVAL